MSCCCIHSIIKALEMPEGWRLVGVGAWSRSEVGVEGCGLFDSLFDGTADEVARTQADGQGQGEDDASEEDAEGEFDDAASNAEVLECHRAGEDENEPLDSHGKKAGVLQLRVDGSDQHAAGEEASKECTGDDEKRGADDVGNVRKEEE